MPPRFYQVPKAPPLVPPDILFTRDFRPLGFQDIDHSNVISTLGSRKQSYTVRMQKSAFATASSGTNADNDAIVTF